MPPLGADEVQRLLKQASGRGHTGTRNRALVAAFAGVGLGVSEALALEASSLELERGVVRVDGARARGVAVPASVMGTLAAWAADRERLGIPPGPLFCTRAGLPLEASYVRRLIARLGKAAGLSVRPLNARSLRESYAVARIAAGATIEELSAELGHATVASTQRFVRQFEGFPMQTPGLRLLPEVADALLGLTHGGLAVLAARRDENGAVEEFVVEYVNPAAAGIMGRSPEGLPGTPVSQIFPNAPTDGTYARWIALIASDAETAQDPRLFESEGQTRSFRVRRTAVGDRVVMSWEDQGAARQARHALGQLEARHAALLEACPAGVAMTDPEGVVVAANSAAHTIMGIPTGRFVGRTLRDPRWRSTMPDGSRLQPAHRPAIITQATGQPVRDLEVDVERPDGRLARVSVSTEAIEGGGPPYGVVITLLDLARLRSAEARARAAEEARGLMHALCSSALLRCRPDGTVIGATGATLALLGEEPGGLVGHHWQRSVTPDDRGVVREAGIRAMETQEVVVVEHRTLAGVRVTRSIHAVREPTTSEVEEVQSLVVGAEGAGDGSGEAPATG